MNAKQVQRKRAEVSIDRSTVRGFNSFRPRNHVGAISTSASSVAFRANSRSAPLNPTARADPIPAAPSSVSSARFFSRYGGGWDDRGSRRSENDRRGSFKLDALAFSVSPDDALRDFLRWAADEQGLGRFLLDRKSVRIGAAYAPVWSFDVNLRFAATDPGSGRTRYDLKPEPFAVYRNDVVHVPGLSAYAGYAFRRSLMNPVHSTSLVFMGDKTVPFGSWMLRDMRLSNGKRVEVFPDPWNATKGRAFAVVMEELENLAEDDADRIGPCEVQAEILSARRVYMPTFVVDYSVLGAEYRAFVSGCDAASGVSGVDHRAFSFSGDAVQRASNSFLNQVQDVTRWGRHVGVGPLIAGINLLMNVLARILSRFHIIGAIGAGFMAFRKIVKPWMDNRSASAEWERQRENEAYMHDHWDHTNDFVDGGYAKRYFHGHREQILRYLSGEQVHDEGDFDWYKQWEEWARRQWEQQQRMYEQQARQTQQQQQYGRRTYEEQSWEEQQQRARESQRQTKQKKEKEFVWDFDPNDPYSVLGIRRGATKQQVSEAFRREMLKYHPDTQGGEATEAERERALERSKLITEAYRKIKAQMK